jgi:hypothetical protein
LLGTSTNLLELLKQKLQTEGLGSRSILLDTLVHAITINWKDDPNTLLWLKARAQTDENSDVRMVAVQELAQQQLAQLKSSPVKPG